MNPAMDCTGELKSLGGLTVVLTFYSFISSVSAVSLRNCGIDNTSGKYRSPLSHEPWLQVKGLLLGDVS